MKNTLLLMLLFVAYGLLAQTSPEKSSKQYPAIPGNNQLLLADSAAGQGIALDNICDNLHSAFSFYTAYGLTEQFTNQSYVLNGNISSWIWSFGDNQSLSGSNSNPAHTYAIAGTYTVCLTVVWNVEGGPTCQDSVCTAVTVNFTGIEDLNDNDVAIYPNPSNGYIIVRSNLPVQSYSIYNAVGEKLDEQKNDGDIIHLPKSLANGIYFIHLNTTQGTLIKKLLLQNQ